MDATGDESHSIEERLYVVRSWPRAVACLRREKRKTPRYPPALVLKASTSPSNYRDLHFDSAGRAARLLTAWIALGAVPGKAALGHEHFVHWLTVGMPIGALATCRISGRGRGRGVAFPKGPYC